MNGKMEKFIEDALISPRELHFESSSRCNAKCIICPREGMTREQGEMEWETFKKGIDEARCFHDRLEYIHLHVNGEPLFLDINELVNRIDYAKELCPHARICFFTNGSLLDRKKTEKILNSKLDILVFSVDGGNKEIYEKVRIGLKWDMVYENIRWFMQRRKELEKTKPVVKVFMIPMKQNEDTIEQFYNVFREIGVDEVGASGVNNIGGLVDNISILHKYQYMDGDVKKPCWRVFNDLSILSDGRACICCQDVQGKQIVGDLRTETLLEVWQGEKFQEIRQLMLTRQQDKIDFCGNCDYMRSFADMPKWWDNV